MSRHLRGDYLETDSGNRISRKATFVGLQYILIGGRSSITEGCIIRGDLHRPNSSSSTSAANASTSGTSPSAAVFLGRYNFLESNVIVRPPFKFYKGSPVYYPIKIGNYVCIGSDSVIEAATIGSCVYIGANCVVGKFSIIKDNVIILDNTIISSTVCIPPYSVVAGNPGKVIGELPESGPEVLERRARLIHSLHGATLNVKTSEELLKEIFDDNFDFDFDVY
ncbi:trimeric LpxA-like protein [Dipodascopsis uninucleata]